ncbi:MAG: YlbL family protein [Bacillota bacterium]
MSSRKRSNKKLSRLIGIIFILYILSHFIPTPYYVMSPGIAQELSPVINVENGYQHRGEFLLTAVASQKAVVWDYLYITILKPEGKELELMSEQLPEGMEMQEYIELMSKMMEESKLQAQAVAFRKAGYAVEVNGEGVEVVEVIEDGTAAGELKKDDLIIAVDDKSVELAADAVNIIRNRKIGKNVKLTVLRDGEKLNFDLQTVELEGNPGNPSIGVLITTKNLNYDIPKNVEFKTDNIIGPSAGGVFALEIYNQLIEEDITGGLKIAGTGTINLDGTIGQIDGVEQKIIAAQKAGADLFIVPEDNFSEAEKYAESLQLISVKNIDDVLEYLKENVK